MKRLKKDLERILATRIVISLQGEVMIDVPLEAFYHLQNFLGSPLPLDLPLSKVAKGYRARLTPRG